MTEAATQSPTPVEPSFEPLQGMRSLRVLARLLDYPTQELQDASGELIEILNAERRLGAALKSSLMEWCQRLQEGDLLELQAEYVAMFDKGRATSLLLFEHVHGESRDRGQAMVDLMAEYSAAGFELDARELPDHIPVFLEYLSMCDDAEIGRWLGEIRHILALLTARLEERGADHALVPLSLLALIGAEGDVEEHRPQVKKEAPDNTPEALDAVWEEEAVRFSATSDEDCALQSAEGRRLAERKHTVQSQPVRIMPAPSLNASSAPSADR
ncbi:MULTISPECIES: nitrate reductase molybdenum cofactor assembly chaperone [Halomonadaceae]|jgi:nitrate reductase molybdenum cofactor assembly chaperone NarJ/NarW|nr:MULTISPECIES: nitrate reductase molybdenum cofactor assembly chaperone [Halomonas]UEQ06358.1 nitrate reductase molybdenum cofactor assembly chaperone [Halomonas profundus]KIN15015.1 nitrate reductase [Halomonas sp. KHS3]MCE7517309.1 nitrate reductase molybdenum cofactor assembly chaperone [Halomonas titanicae]NVE89882.1 nitrate reductase molybdenum cofactor assembly chaperone [Halomonas titanicae]QKS23413.1 Nitrate reductase molybdenum cofactor assembly chaperone NarJ [Halomonas titanicae]